MAMPAPSEPLARAPRIWAVGGGKGGVGKSVVTSSLAPAMAGLRRRCAVIDAALGAGSAFNVLDLFLLAQRGLVVVTPEPTAIENAEHFLRAAVYRSLRFAARRPDVHAAIAQLREKHHKRRVRSAQELIALVREIDPTAAKPLEERAVAFAPILILNQVQSVEHRRAGPELVASCRDRHGVAIELAASIDHDPSVRAAV